MAALFLDKVNFCENIRYYSQTIEVILDNLSISEFMKNYFPK